MPPSVEQDAVDVRLLGTFEVASGGRVLEIGSPKQRALLAMLVLHLNRVVPLDLLVEELWGERPLASASASAQTLVSRLRRSLSEICPDETALCLRGREPGLRRHVNSLQSSSSGTRESHRLPVEGSPRRCRLGRSLPASSC